MKNHYLLNHFYFAGLIVLGFACLISSCAEKEDDIALILSLVQKAEVLAENHDTGKLMELTSKYFKAQDGKLRRQQVRKFLWLSFRRYGQFDLLFPQPAVEISDNKQAATVIVHFLVVKKERRWTPKVEPPEGWVKL